MASPSLFFTIICFFVVVMWENLWGKKLQKKKR